MKQILLKTLIAATFITVSISSCKKDSDLNDSSLTANHNTKAVVPGVIHSATFPSAWGNPYNAASYGTVNYDLVNNTVAVLGEALFSGQVNNTLSGGSGFSLHYIYDASATLTLASVNSSHFSSTYNYTAASSIGQNTAGAGIPNGWFNYASPSPTPIAGFFAVLDDGFDTYVIQLTGFPNAASRAATTDQNGDGVVNGRDIEVKSDVAFNYKQL